MSEHLEEDLGLLVGPHDGRDRRPEPPLVPAEHALGLHPAGVHPAQQVRARDPEQGAVSYESALFYATNPSEFALRASGINSASDRTFTEITGNQAAGRSQDFTA